MFWHLANQKVPVEHRRIVVDVIGHDPDLGVASQALVSARFVVGQDVEVPDRPAPRRVTVEWTRQVDLARVRVDDERAVLRELTGQCVADVRAAIGVWVDSAHLFTSQNITSFCLCLMHVLM